MSQASWSTGSSPGTSSRVPGGGEGRLLAWEGVGAQRVTHMQGSGRRPTWLSAEGGRAGRMRGGVKQPPVSHTVP